MSAAQDTQAAADAAQVTLMTAKEHIETAALILAQSVTGNYTLDAVLVGRAQVHATLAVAKGGI